MGGLTASIEYANLILTGSKGPKRTAAALKKAQKDLVTDEWLQQIPVLHVGWLADSKEKKIMQEYGKYRVLNKEAESTTVAAGDVPVDAPAKKNVKKAKVKVKEDDTTSVDTETKPQEKKKTTKKKKPSLELEPVPVTSEFGPAPPWQNSEFCCQRPTPLKSVHNQQLVDELEIIRKQRALTSQIWSDKSYSGCLSAIKAFPYPVNKETLPMVAALRGVGQKMITVIEQYCETGHIVEAQQILSDPANPILFDFMSLYGVGPVSARSLYERGCRTVEDVIAQGKSLATQLDIEDCYSILPDLKMKIPRAEVEELARLVHSEVDSVCPGSHYKICGGYRRGKPDSSDVDIIISNNDTSTPFISERLGIINQVLDQLRAKNLMPFAVNVMGGAEATDLKSETRGHLDIAEIVVLPPKSDKIPTPRHRRIDLVFCSPFIYGAAVVGWTGSTNFEKDIRRWAKTKGYKFDSSGLVSQSTRELVETRDEMDVFRILELEYMPPELRNCDA